MPGVRSKFISNQIDQLYQTDSYAGDGGTTIFDLTKLYDTTNPETIVTVNGLVQAVTTDYSLSVVVGVAKLTMVVAPLLTHVLTIKYRVAIT